MPCCMHVILAKASKSDDAAAAKKAEEAKAAEAKAAAEKKAAEEKVSNTIIEEHM